MVKNNKIDNNANNNRLNERKKNLAKSKNILKFIKIKYLE